MPNLLHKIFNPYQPHFGRLRYEYSLYRAHSDEIDDVCGLCFCAQTIELDKNKDECDGPPVILTCCGNRRIVGKN